MKLVTTIAAVVLIAAPLALAKDKKKDNKPSALFSTAQYVYVQAEDGPMMDPNLLPEDRQAISDVLDALQDWNRYVITYNRSEADLVIKVRKGRLATAGLRAGAMGPPYGQGRGSSQDPADPSNPNRNGSGIGRGVGVGSEAGPPDDTLRVFSAMPDGKLSGSPIWWREMADGLDAPDVRLLRSLRSEVERAYPPQPVPQKKP